MIVEYESESAKELADLYSIYQDLKEVMEMLEQLQNDHPDIIKAALYQASLIKYRRCFSSGVRGKLQSDDLEIIEGGKIYHEHKIDLASKFVAHSVSAFEVPTIGVEITDDGIIGLHNHHVKLTGTSRENYSQFKRFIVEIVQRIVLPMFKELNERVLKEVEGRPLVELKSLPEIQMKVPSYLDAKKSR